jgi:hypothetical protein
LNSSSLLSILLYIHMLNMPARGLRRMPIDLFGCCCRCVMCLGDDQIYEKLQQLIVYGPTFHLEYIDRFLANNTTCPLCLIISIPLNTENYLIASNMELTPTFMELTPNS